MHPFDILLNQGVTQLYSTIRLDELETIISNGIQANNNNDLSEIESRYIYCTTKPPDSAFLQKLAERHKNQSFCNPKNQYFYNWVTICIDLHIVNVKTTEFHNYNPMTNKQDGVLIKGEIYDILNDRSIRTSLFYPTPNMTISR